MNEPLLVWPDKADIKDRTAMEEAVDEDLRLFDEWFQGLGNAPLVKPEKAAIKTYLWFKLFGKEQRDGT